MHFLSFVSSLSRTVRWFFLRTTHRWPLTSLAVGFSAWAMVVLLAISMSLGRTVSPSHVVLEMGNSASSSYPATPSRRCNDLSCSKMLCLAPARSSSSDASIQRHRSSEIGRSKRTRSRCREVSRSRELFSRRLGSERATKERHLKRERKRTVEK